MRKIERLLLKKKVFRFIERFSLIDSMCLWFIFTKRCLSPVLICVLLQKTSENEPQNLFERTSRSTRLKID